MFRSLVYGERCVRKHTRYRLPEYSNLQGRRALTAKLWATLGAQDHNPSASGSTSCASSALRNRPGTTRTSSAGRTRRGRPWRRPASCTPTRRRRRPPRRPRERRTAALSTAERSGRSSSPLGLPSPRTTRCRPTCASSPRHRTNRCTVWPSTKARLRFKQTNTTAMQFSFVLNQTSETQRKKSKKRSVLN
jgi:hypothetical protein